MRKLFDILHEDPELLVINKPAGLVCHPTKGDEYSSLVSRVRLHVGGQIQPQLVNRLDRETSGVIVVSKDAVTARALRRLWESREVYKEYLAVVHGHFSEPHGLIDAALGKDECSHVAIKDCVRPDGASAQTEYWVVDELRRTFPRGFDRTGQQVATFTVVRVVPQTGRKHQIRIHLAHLGHPIVGDKLYGGDEDLYLALVENRLTAEQKHRLILPHHALHAREVRFMWRGEEQVFRAEPEEWLKEFIADGRGN